MPDPMLIGIDLGTTRLKVAAFDVEGNLLAREADRNVEHREGDREWQEPDEWWETLARLCRRLLEHTAVAGREVAGVGLSGRGGGFVALDERGDVVVESWSDRRHRHHLQQLYEWREGGIFLPNYTAALLAKHLWLREAEPVAAERVARIMYAKDFLLHRITGEVVTDPSSGPDRDDFDRPSISTLGLDPGILPRVDLPWSIAGTVTAEAAETLGIAPGTPVAVGAHDGVCANVGAGAGRPGAYAITVGTNMVVRAVVEDSPPGAFRFYGMPPGRHVIGGNAFMAGRAGDWFLDAWRDRPDEAHRPAAFAEMDVEAGAVPVGADGVTFLALLSGEQLPVPRPEATGAFTGLRARHGRAEMYRALLEGSACALRAVFEQVRGWCGEPRIVRFTGGGALSATWRQIIVDVLDQPCEATDGSAEARGAAIYAAVALGYYGDVDEAADAMVRPTSLVEPDPRRARAYKPVYRRWLAVREALRPLDEAEAAP